MRALDLRKIADQRITEHRRTTVESHGEWIDGVVEQVIKIALSRAKQGVYYYKHPFGHRDFPKLLTNIERNYLLDELVARFEHFGYHASQTSSTLHISWGRNPVLIEGR